MLNKLLKVVGLQNEEDRRAKLERELMRHEARIGGQLFGPIPPGGRREFFCLDEHTWVWHEEWIDNNGNKQIRTTRYDVRPDGILKAQDGKRHYERVSEQEALRLYEAAKIYKRRVKNEVYRRVS